MELLRLLALTVVSTPAVDAALPMTPAVARVRAALLRPGDSPQTVERALGLRRYTWVSGGFTGVYWLSSYHDPETRHSITVHYRRDPAACTLRLREVEVKR